MNLPECVRKYLVKGFVYAVSSNKGDQDGTRTALRNVVKHAYGEHASCGDWCGYSRNPEDYVHKGLPKGAPLSSVELRPELEGIFERFASQAEKICPCASSQSNESFNNLAASKHPKAKHYGRSESFNYRIAAAVSQKNIGTKYIVDVNQTCGLSPGQITRKMRKMKDKYRAKRCEAQKTKAYKLRRNIWKQRKSRQGAAAERREGFTYQSECGLQGIADLLDDPLGKEIQFKAKQLTLIFYYHLSKQ